MSSDPDARLHADEAARQVRKSASHLATRQLLTKYDGPSAIKTDEMKRILADVDADGCHLIYRFAAHGSCSSHSAPGQKGRVRSTVGPSH